MECAGFYGALGGHPPNKEAIEDEESDRLQLRRERKRIERVKGRRTSREAASSAMEDPTECRTSSDERKKNSIFTNTVKKVP